MTFIIFLIFILFSCYFICLFPNCVNSSMKTNAKQREKPGVNSPMLVLWRHGQSNERQQRWTPFCMLTLNVTCVFLFDHCRLDISRIRSNIVCGYTTYIHSGICITIFFWKTVWFWILSSFDTKTSPDALAQAKDFKGIQFLLYLRYFPISIFTIIIIKNTS